MQRTATTKPTPEPLAPTRKRYTDPALLAADTADKIIYRTLETADPVIDESARTVEFSLSSEYAGERWFGTEILDHDSQSIRLSRMTSGSAPLLLNHNTFSQIGVIERSWLGADRRLHVLVRFSKNPTAEEVFRDVIDGIRRNVSVGYLVHRWQLQETGDDGDTWRAIDWEPYEASIVAVPFDPTVGVGRSLPPTTPTPETTRGSVMDEDEVQNKLNPPTAPATRAQPAADAAGERARIREITAITRQFNVDATLCDAAIEAGTTVDQFRAQVLDRLKPVTPTAGTPNAGLITSRDLGLSDSEIRRYSTARAVRALYDPAQSRHAGLEMEVSAALAGELGRDARGLFIPFDALVRSLQSKGTAAKGGVLVDIDLAHEQLIELLRPHVLAGQLGAQILPGLIGDLDIPRQLTDPVFEWVAEDVAGNASSVDLGLLQFRPKTITGNVPMTRRLLQQTNGFIETLVNRALLAGYAAALDRAAFIGSGTGAEPTGVANQAGIGAVTWSAATPFAFENAVALKSAVLTGNIDPSAQAFVTHSTTAGVFETTKKDAGSGIFVLSDGKMAGAPVRLSNHLTTADQVTLYGDWTQLLIALWGALEIKVDEATKAATGGKVLRLFGDADVQVARAAAFAKGRKV